MKPLTEKLFQVYTRIDGMRVWAFVATSALGNSQNQKVPFRLFVVRSPSLVTVGDVINAEQGEKIILLEHPSDNNWSQNFKAAFARISFDWIRPTTMTDTVTGFKKEDVPVSMGKIYANFDTPIDDGVLTMNETEYRFLTGSDVHVRDIVGGKTVSKVQKVLGVNLVYAAGT